MAKTYWVSFGNTLISTFSGLSPTFIQFWNASGSTITPPAISEIGSSSGLYKFTYTPTVSIGFVIDGFTTMLSSSERFIAGSLDPSDNIDGFMGTTLLGIGATIAGIGNTLSAIGSSSNILALIGSTGSTFGGVGTDPLDLFGYMKRAQEFWEGNDSFSKATGVWSIYSRGASYQIQSKTLSNDVTGVTKI